MKRLKTLSGKSFQYKSCSCEEFIIYPSDNDDNTQDKFALVVTPYTTNLIKSAIKQKRQLPMGASRDNPPNNSLGAILKSKQQTPQQLSYLIPILIDEGYCNYFKEGNAFIVKYKGD